MTDTEEVKTDEEHDRPLGRLVPRRASPPGRRPVVDQREATRFDHLITAVITISVLAIVVILVLEGI